MSDKKDNIRELPNIEKDANTAAFQAIARNAPMIAVSMKAITEALIDAGYTNDEALRLTVMIFTGKT